MNETAKRIGFTDGDCHILFFVPDGGNIVLTHSDGARLVCPCKCKLEMKSFLAVNLQKKWNEAAQLAYRNIHPACRTCASVRSLPLGN